MYLQVFNFPLEFCMRVSVVTNETKPRPHIFKLTGDNCEKGIYLKSFQISESDRRKYNIM